MELNLIKPLAVFDLETTGTNVATDRIIEISIIKINPDGKEHILTQRVNPTIPIPRKPYSKNFIIIPLFLLFLILYYIEFLKMFCGKNSIKNYQC